MARLFVFFIVLALPAAAFAQGTAIISGRVLQVADGAPIVAIPSGDMSIKTSRERQIEESASKEGFACAIIERGQSQNRIGGECPLFLRTPNETSPFKFEQSIRAREP